MNWLIYSVFNLISLVLLITAFIHARKLSKEIPHKKRIITPFQFFIVGAFISIVMIFVPVYYSVYFSGSAGAVFRPLLLAIHNTMRVFILDGEFDIIRDAAKDLPVAAQISYTGYAAIMYILAPLLTASFILSLFKNLSAAIKINVNKRRSLFIFSELNEKSLALAKSIANDKTIPNNPLLVFCDVFEKNEEKDYELISAAREIGAICFKRDISNINISRRHRKKFKGNEDEYSRVEYFLIGEDEAENIKQAIDILKNNTINLKPEKAKKGSKNKSQESEAEKYGKDAEGNTQKTETEKSGKAVKAEPPQVRNRPNTRVFVFATSVESEHIIDSLDKGCITVRRIDVTKILAWDLISGDDVDIFNKTRKIGDEDLISVLIVGLGTYGTELFKTVLWYCQMIGYRLEVNVVDLKAKADGKLKSECSEIYKMNNCTEPGEAHYSFEIISDTDIFTADFDEALFYKRDNDPVKERTAEQSKEIDKKLRIAERLRRTTIVFTALGNDDANIEAAIKLRKLFDRSNGIVVKNNDEKYHEDPAIYSIVYGETKKENVGSKLMNYNKTRFNIHFVGDLSSKYSYREIWQEDKEKEARGYHAGWEKNKEKLSRIKKHNVEKTNNENNNAEVFDDFEYYRNSSLSQALHKNAVKKLGKFDCKYDERTSECRCVDCENRRVIEHMRWNAYMRAYGYVYGEKRADRAKVHNLLKAYSKLDNSEKSMDSDLATNNIPDMESSDNSGT